jgi:hypothetical protein
MTTAKIEHDQLERMRQLRNDSIRFSRRAEAAAASLRAEVAEALIDRNVNVEAGIVCLDCGAVHADPRGCPDCSEGSQ